LVARRKPVDQRLWDTYKRRRREKEEARRRAKRQAEKDEERRRLAATREAERRQQAAEQDERRRQREDEALERRRAREAETARTRADEEKRRAVVREVKPIEREQDRRTEEAKKRRQREAIQRRQREAERRSAGVEARLAELEALLGSRPRNLHCHRPRVDETFERGGARAVADLVAQLLNLTPWPDGFPRGCAAGYAPESRELLISYELPRQDILPMTLGYRYVKARDAIDAVPRKEADCKSIYRRLLARTVLRALASVFDATPPALVDSVAINAYVAAKDRSTGKPVDFVLISVNALREPFEDLVLDEPELDPVLCLQRLNAIVSPHPYDLEPVPPVVQFDLARFKLVEGMDVAAGLDSRPDLLQMDPKKFENLVRELFIAIGMKAWVTQASRDDGIDAVATNEDPVVGGLCVIQAKRYRNIVGLESVHALAGAMNDKAAAKGVLVTTSWFGKASRDFVARNGRMELIDGRELKALLLEHLDLDVLIGLDKLPRGWQRRDIT
jgi:restriction system protein